jgi:eukaryotic-like serine/threonine-protein kinase
MEPDRLYEVERVYHAALERDESERAVFLRAICGADEALHDEVASLLAGGLQAEEFMESPALELEARALGRDEAWSHTSASANRADDSGVVIGRYQLREKIGQGGFGTVYVADQKEPVRRRVALKVINLGMDTRAVIARFEAERQALAMMDHPNIAKVLDAGATENGRPFFVMELVRGISITDYCDLNRLSTEARLKLFVQVCNAIQHAHQKGIIHRDIKPANILVTLHDGAPVPKVIDFGISKATQGNLVDKTVYTQFRQFMGTPAYMSPEQAEMSGLDIDTRSDIYSLGVLLYELLTGKTPFDAKALLAQGLDEMRRSIREEEPARPSTRLKKMADAESTTVANQRNSNALTLVHTVRGDLDCIVMKSLEKDRARRYETANGLATDIHRHLSHEPVTARPPSAAYRVERMIRRNRLAFAAGSAIVVAVMAGIVVSSWQAVRATKARAETVRALAASEEARLEAQAVSKYLVLAFRSFDPSQDGRDIKVADVLDRAVADFDTNFAGAPKIKGDLLAALGQTYTGLGLTAKALDLLERARVAHQAVLGPDHPDTLGINIDIVQAYRIGRRLADAVPLLEDTLKQSRAKLGPDHPLTLTTMKDLGDAYQAAGRASDAVPMLEDALKRSKATLGADHPTTLFTMNNLAGAYRSAGRTADAVPLLEETLKRMKLTLGRDHRDTLNTTDNLANAYRAIGRSADAVRMLEETLSVCQAKFGPDHPDTLNTMNYLGDAYRQAGRPADAVPMLERTLTLMKAKLGPDNVMTLEAINNLALAYRAAGRPVVAVSMLEETLKRLKDTLGPGHSNTLNTANNLAGILRVQGKLREAQSVYREVLDARRKALPPEDRAIGASAIALGSVLREEGKPDEAEPLLTEGLQIRRRVLGDDHAATLALIFDLANLLQDQGRLSEAEPFFAELYRRTPTSKVDPKLAARYLTKYGQILVRLGRDAEALEPLIEARRRLEQTQQSASPWMQEVTSALAEVCQQNNRTDQTGAWRTRAGSPCLSIASRVGRTGDRSSPPSRR